MPEQQSKAATILEKVFWAYLFINPLLDIINGFYISLVSNVGILDVEFISTLGVTPSLLIRMLFLVAFGLYLIIVRDKRAILTALPIGLAWVLSMVSEYVRLGALNFFVDAQYMARFCYNIVILMVYSRVFFRRWGYDGKDLRATLNTVSIYTMTILSLAVLFPAIFGLGYSTYADPLGYRGNRGFFYAGNDITAILALLLPILILVEVRSASAAKEMSGNDRFAFFPALAAGLGANALMVIGSKTAFIALGVSMAVMLLATVFFALRSGDRRMVRGYLYVLLTALVIFILINTISVIQQYGRLKAEFGYVTGQMLLERSILSSILHSADTTAVIFEEGDIEVALLSGRHLKLQTQLAEYRSGGILVWLFGLSRGSQEYVIEMDIFEVLCYYGIFGLAAMLWLYVWTAVCFIRDFFRKFSLEAIALFIGIGLTVGYMVVAGHVLFSVTSGFYLSFAILFSRVVFAERPEDILLWKTAK